MEVQKTSARRYLLFKHSYCIHILAEHKSGVLNKKIRAFIKQINGSNVVWCQN